MATQRQLDNRKSHLGASDISSILGLNPYKSAYDVFLEKTGKVDTSFDTPVSRLGQELEQAILNIAEKDLGKLTRNQYRSVKGEGIPIGSLCDSILDATGEPVEAKSTGIVNRVMGEQWGEAGTDDVPHRVIIQAETQILCTGADICYVPALIGGRGYCMFIIKKDDEIISIITEKAIAFWNNNILKDMPPENVYPSMTFLKKIKREAKKTVDIAEELVHRWLVAKEDLKLSEKLKEEAEVKLLTDLGVAEAGNCPQGLVTYFTQSRKPKICPKCSTVVSEGCEFPVLRFKVNKELPEGKK